MKSEKIVMGDAPDEKAKSRKGILFAILAILAVLIIVLIVVKPFTKSSEPQKEPVVTMTEQEPSATQQTINETPVKEKVPVSETSVTETGKKVEPAPQTPPSEVIHIVAKGECLWLIAEIEYQNPFAYPKIRDANNIPNENLIYPGQKLIIPKK